MSEKQKKMQSTCRTLCTAARILLALLAVFMLVCIGFSIYAACLPSERFTLAPHQGGWRAGINEHAAPYISINVPANIYPAEGRPPQSPRGAYFAGMISGLLFSIGALGLEIWYLSRILERAAGGQPFAKDSSTDLRRLGVTLLLSSLFYPFCFSLLFSWLARASLSLQINNLGPLLIAALVLALAHVFSYGAELQSEVDDMV